MRKPASCICEKIGAEQLTVTVQLISAFVFTTQIVQSLYSLNLKFLASSHLLWLYSSVCVEPGRKLRKEVFSWPKCVVFRFAAAKRNGDEYFILLIITDGIITDMPQTCEAIVNVGTLKLRDNCIQKFYLGSYIVAYTVENFVLQRHVRGAV